MTNSEEIFRKLRDLKPRFKDMNLKRVSVFGSVARGDAGPDSDVDLLVEFIEKPSGWDLAGLYGELEDYLGRDVDIVQKHKIYPPLKENILREARDV